MEYLVMECLDSYAVLLDEEGRFVKAANLGYEIGERITNPILMRDTPLETIENNRKQTSKLNRLTAGIVAIAAMVALFFGFNYYQTNYVPYSSIFMAINPEVEMVLNKKGEVIDVNGVNEDGVTLLQDYELSSKDKIIVLNELVDQAIALGFLAEGGQVSIAIDTPDQMLFEEYGIELRRELDGRISIAIEITDIENKNQPPTSGPNPGKSPPPETSTPQPPTSTEDDSGYDDSAYGEIKTPAPGKSDNPTDDEDEDDSDYDDSDYDEDDD